MFPFNDTRFYIADYTTGLIKTTHICHNCRAEFDYEPLHYQIRMPVPGKKGFPEIRFWCSDACYEEEQ